jgi:hypothetical protein
MTTDTTTRTALVAQPAEQRFRKPTVGGSKPSEGSNFYGSSLADLILLYEMVPSKVKLTFQVPRPR